MHIPDGYLSPQTYVPLYGVSFLFWSMAIRRLKKELAAKHIPYQAMAAVFAFLTMMFNLPIPGGTTGHATGAGVIAILLGPWAAVVAVSVVLIIQAIVFGDGGITAIGANCFNMAGVMPFSSYWVFKLIKGKAVTGAGLSWASFLSGYVGLSLSGIITGIEFGIQPLIASGPDGRPLYAPYPLSIALPVMALEHLLFFSIIEGTITVLLFKYFIKNEPDIIHALSVKKD